MFIKCIVVTYASFTLFDIFLKKNSCIVLVKNTCVLCFRLQEVRLQVKFYNLQPRSD